jgi:hypothetical protein
MFSPISILRSRNWLSLLCTFYFRALRLACKSITSLMLVLCLLLLVIEVHRKFVVNPLFIVVHFVPRLKD